MITSKRLLAATALLLIGAAPALAEDRPFRVSLGLLKPTGDTYLMTQRPFGFSLELGYSRAPEGWGGLKYKAYAGTVRFKGDSGHQGNVWINNDLSPAIPQMDFTFDLTGYNYGVDLIYPVTVKGQAFSVFLGPSVHHWFVDRLPGTDSTGDKPVTTGRLSQGDSRPRAGWRLGIGYQLNEQFDLSLAYTISEWRSHPVESVPYQEGANPSRPCYATLAVTFKF